MTIYIVIQVSGCVGRGPSALLCPGVYYAVKMALGVNEHKRLSNITLKTQIKVKEQCFYHYVSIQSIQTMITSTINL